MNSNFQGFNLILQVIKETENKTGIDLLIFGYLEFSILIGVMGCNNSHLRPFFRRCRRRRSKKDDPSVTPKGDYIEIERNGPGDLSHGIQFLGASLRNSNNKTSEATPGDSTFCVPLLAQA